MKTNSLFAVIAFLIFSLSAWSKNVPPDKRPNILWITCEDMSANLPFYGDSTIVTPHLSRLAAQSVRYTNMYSVSGVCAPSRSAIITGMYPTSIGTQHMRTASDGRSGLVNYEAVLPPEVKAFPEYLRAAGYYCTNNEKTDYQFGKPVTVWDENSHKAHWRNRPKDKPFFSVFNFTRTHESQIWTHKDKPLRVDPASVPLPPYYPESPVIRKDIARYYDNIMVMDSLAGSILRQLEEDGLMENTIIFFFSDHGAGLPWYKRELYDRGLHVPLTVKFPDNSGAGTINDELLSLIDLAPTVLSLANISIPAHIQGQAFLGGSKATAPRQYIYAARDRMDEWHDLVRAVRDKHFKYIRNYQPDKPNYQDIAYRRQMDLMQEILRLKEAGKLNEVQNRWFATKPVEELYDIRNDPYELKNLAADPAYLKQLERLRNEQDKWLMQTQNKGFMTEKDMLEMMWPGMKQPETHVPEIEIVNQSKKASTVHITCPTAGASITYKIGEKGAWLLYANPVKLSKGENIIAKAIRYGYKESPEVSLVASEKLSGK